MSGLLIGLLVVAGVVLVIVLWFVGVYNGLVGMRNQVKNAWSQIDVQLKRRYDLIPNLVETVKGYAKHEREVFENVTKARSACMAATGPADVAKAENFLSQTLKSLFAVAEAYPELKANQNFLALQEELTSTENKVSFARQFYNDTVMRYNTRIQTVPSNIVAGMFSFTAEQFFQTENAAERQAVKVQF
jgi:LemA protein